MKQTVKVEWFMTFHPFPNFLRISWMFEALSAFLKLPFGEGTQAVEMLSRPQLTGKFLKFWKISQRKQVNMTKSSLLAMVTLISSLYNVKSFLHVYWGCTYIHTHPWVLFRCWDGLVVPEGGWVHFVLIFVFTLQLLELASWFFSEWELFRVNMVIWWRSFQIKYCYLKVMRNNILLK